MQLRRLSSARFQLAANVAAHELGHAIGLADNENPTMLMCSSRWCINVFPSNVFLALTDHEKIGSSKCTRQIGRKKHHADGRLILCPPVS